MSNMSYCRFTNTRSDMDDCLNALCRDERLRGREPNLLNLLVSTIVGKLSHQSKFNAPVLPKW